MKMLSIVLFVHCSIGLMAGQSAQIAGGKDYPLVPLSIHGVSFRNGLICGDYFILVDGRTGPDDGKSGIVHFEVERSDPTVPNIGGLVRRTKIVTVIDNEIKRPTVRLLRPGPSKDYPQAVTATLYLIRISAADFRSARPCLPDSLPQPKA